MNKSRENLKNKDQEKLNPCLREQELTYKCFNDNNYDKEQCQLEIDNYNTCKSFWHSVKADRRRQGITPYLPPLEERQRIKEEYFNKVKNASKSS